VGACVCVQDVTHRELSWVAMVQRVCPLFSTIDKIMSHTLCLGSKEPIRCMHITAHVLVLYPGIIDVCNTWYSLAASIEIVTLLINIEARVSIDAKQPRYCIN
jgi:hypothetical protein